MTCIAILPIELASQIAAGEVVERPASAIKELLENSLDAGAGRIEVTIEGGGITRMLVVDDGEGMTESDALLAIQRHATSKILRFEDLRTVATFGYRGEALPSIASVSRFCLRTRTKASDMGTEVYVEGGTVAGVRPVGLPVGTHVEVRDLFFNVPARRKFLKSSGTESAHVADVVGALALARPNVTLTLTRDGRQIREWLRAAGREDRVLQWQTGEKLAVCRGQRGPLTLEAFLSPPERARTGTTDLMLLVNGRVVRDRAIAVSVAQAYGSILERGRYPRGTVYLELPPELVDVNVHPQKAEVRFADPRAVADAVFGILSREVAAAFSLPTSPRYGRPPNPASYSMTSSRPVQESAASESHPWGLQPTPAAASEYLPDQAVVASAAPTPRVPRPASIGPGTGTEAASELPAGATSGPPSRPTTASTGACRRSDIPAPDSPNAGSAPAVPPPVTAGGLPEPFIAVRDSVAAPLRPRADVLWSSLRFVAQARQTYLVCEGHDGLYVLDQHAAAERINFHRLRSAYRDRNIASQSLLFPLTIEATWDEISLVEEYREPIAATGLEVRVCGPGTLAVHAVPQLLRRASPERLVRDLLGEISRTGGRGFSDAVDMALAQMACHGSIRAGDALSADEATALLRSLDEADFAGHCPHGRPVVTFTSWADLERKVGRR